MDEIKLGYAQKVWITLCTLFVKSFYRKIEISGHYKLKHNVPIILCANHSNALADAVLLQYTNSRLIHPLARSGLFNNPFMKPILKIWQAVPVYRRQDTGGGVVDNNAMFTKAYEMLAENRILMIFPEGQSHSENRIKPLKTGISRIILGFKEQYNITPRVIPVGLNFSEIKRFRSNVYINFGKFIDINSDYQSNKEQDIKDLTADVTQAMREVVLETSQVDELEFIKQIDRFFSLRNQKNRHRSMSQKFKSQKFILSVKNKLNKIVPEKVSDLQRHLNQFNRLCKMLGINDYHLNINYNSKIIKIFIVRSLAVLFVLLPLALLGIVNCFIPYSLTRISILLSARGNDQVDTAKILAGSLFFSLSWVVQTYYVYYMAGLNESIVYALLLIPGLLAALIILHEQVKILENLKVFYTIVKHKNLRRYLIKRRKKIENEIASLIGLAKKIK